MLTWAVANLLAKKDIWKPPGVAIMLWSAMACDMMIIYFICNMMITYFIFHR